MDLVVLLALGLGVVVEVWLLLIMLAQLHPHRIERRLVELQRVGVVDQVLKRLVLSLLLNVGRQSPQVERLHLWLLLGGGW